MSDDAAFWVEVRGGLIGMAGAAEDPMRRNILRIVAAIERRYELGGHAKPDAAVPPPPRWLDAEPLGEMRRDAVG